MTDASTIGTLSLRGLDQPPPRMNWKTRFVPRLPASRSREMKCGEWDATFRMSNERSPKCRAGTGFTGSGVCDRPTLCPPPFTSNGAADRSSYLQSRHCADHLSFLLELSSSGRSRAVFFADLFRREEACAADR